MDRQKAALVVMSVEQRELLMAMHHVDGVVDVERHRGGWLGVTGTVQPHHDPHHADDLAQAGRVLPARHGRLGTQTVPALRQATAGKFQARVSA
jgi:hypothetical protein